MGANLTNTVANSVQLGFSDTSKIQIDATNGITNYLGQINPGNALLANSTKGIEKVSYRSAILNFLNTGATDILTVPSGFMLLIESIGILTLTITTPAQAPYLELGTASTLSAYLTNQQTSSNGVGAVQWFITPQNGISSGILLQVNITQASTAASHTGVILINGMLVPIT